MLLQVENLKTDSFLSTILGGEIRIRFITLYFPGIKKKKKNLFIYSNKALPFHFSLDHTTRPQ